MNIRSRDHQTYRDLYQTLTEFLPLPDLVICLRSFVPTFIQSIERRGRDYERTIPADYLTSLNNLYENLDRSSMWRVLNSMFESITKPCTSRMDIPITWLWLLLLHADDNPAVCPQHEPDLGFPTGIRY